MPEGSRDRRTRHEERRALRAAVTDPEVVMEAAARFLAVRSRSVAETRRRLRQLGFGERVVEEVLVRLVGLGFLDDGAFARAWVESRDRAHPRGASALRQELLRKGVDDELVRETLGARRPTGVPDDASAADVESIDPAGASVGDADTADHVAAARLLARRAAALAREPDPRRRRQRAYALLARNGFGPETCRVVSRTVVGDGPEDDGPVQP